MTEYEYLDLISTYRSETGFHAMNFIAALFGYIAAAYFVGVKLSKFQVTGITILYTLFAPLPVTAAYESLAATRVTYLEYVANFGTPSYGSTLILWGPELLLFVLPSSWIISIVFMFQTRRVHFSA
jgi:hypothetical protein